jgi:prophage tail gpP-like protein
LFLWTAAEIDENGNPTFVLSEPNGQQAPIAKLTQSETNAYNVARTGHEVSILTGKLHNDTKPRFSEAVVHSRGGGKKFGRTKGKGDFSDPEMLALGYDRPIVMKDVDCQNEKQAEFMARRRIAEGRRSGNSLSYTVSGHTFAAIGGGRGVWAPDTVVDVDDDRLGVKGLFWIESVHFSRSTDQTVTNLTLQRPEDLLFGDVMPPDLATVKQQIKRAKAAAKLPKSSAT